MNSNFSILILVIQTLSCNLSYHIFNLGFYFLSWMFSSVNYSFTFSIYYHACIICGVSFHEYWNKLICTWAQLDPTAPRAVITLYIYLSHQVLYNPSLVTLLVGYKLDGFSHNWFSGRIIQINQILVPSKFNKIILTLELSPSNIPVNSTLTFIKSHRLLNFSVMDIH